MGDDEIKKRKKSKPVAESKKEKTSEDGESIKTPAKSSKTNEKSPKHDDKSDKNEDQDNSNVSKIKVTLTNYNSF